MSKSQASEQFPLLLVLVGDENVSQDNKRFVGRGRFSGITSGATAIITEWPNYLSSCWVTTLICALTLFTLSLLLTSCLTLPTYQRIPRCVDDEMSNKTVHLVHASGWSPNQLSLLQSIAKAFPEYQINVIEINEANKIAKDNASEALKKYPNIVVIPMSYKEVFNNSPLFLNWASLNQQTRIFAVRVLQMWQFGGVSYDLSVKKSRSNFTETKIGSYVRNGKERFEDLEPDALSVDANGWHMECRKPCHAFFENVLKNLRVASRRSTPRGLLNYPLFAFCGSGVIRREDCKMAHFFSNKIT